MKKTKLILKLILLIFGLVQMASTAAALEYSYGDYDGTVYPAEEMDSLIESLPDEVRGEIEDYISAENDEKRLDAVKDKLDVGYWISYVAGQVKNFLFPALVSCVPLMTLIIISVLIKKLMPEGKMGEICDLTVSLVCAVIVGGIALKAISCASGFITRSCTVMNAMLPVMNAVILASGGVTQASVSSAGLMLYLTAMENITRAVLVPLSGALFALGTVSGVFKGVNISSLISGVRRIVMTLISFSLLVYSFIFGIQTSLAKGADTFALKTVRFAIGSYIPIVGGAVADALSTVSAGLALVRRLTGAVGIVIILMFVLPTVVSLFITRLSLLICKSAAEILECNVAAGIVGDADCVLSLFLAFSAMTGVFFIFSVILFMNSGIS